MNQGKPLIQMVWNIDLKDEEIFLTMLESEGYQCSVYREVEWEFSQVLVYTREDLRQMVQEQIFDWISWAQENGYLTERDRNYHEIPLYEEDWLNHWKKYFSPILVGEKLEILPAWLSSSNGRISLLLEPKMGFGTGQHESTYLCLSALEREDLSGKQILDIGAGSGILGVAGILLGASHAVLLEKDLLSIESCEDTVERNRVQEQVTILKEDVFCLPPVFQRPYDFAMINILAEVIVDILKLPWLSDISVLYLSGILKERRTMVLDALQAHQYKILDEKSLGAWIFFRVQLADRYIPQ